MNEKIENLIKALETVGYNVIIDDFGEYIVLQIDEGTPDDYFSYLYLDKKTGKHWKM